MPTHEQQVRAELDRQDRDGIACTVCGTRYHATSVDLDAWCPVCRARALVEQARVDLLSAARRFSELGQPNMAALCAENANALDPKQGPS